MTDPHSTDQHPYELLSPDLVVDAVESTGLLSDLRILALNSYENRVYQVGIEDAEPLIVKFYRPERWSDEQILEEHRFCHQLFEAEIPVVPPSVNEAGETLHTHAGFRFSIYPRKGGHAPALDDLDSLFQLGRLAARIHAIAALEPFAHRPALSIESFGDSSAVFLLEHFIPGALRPAYETLTRDLLYRIRQQFDEVQPDYQRVHGDCHVGNILWRGDDVHFVDLDDSRMAPAIQDIWMFMSGSRDAQQRQLSELVEGYNEFNDFPTRQLPLIEALRTLRIMHYSAWLARRWNDPAFPRTFPWFNTERYWAEHILELREQLALLNEPPLEIF
ncbi:MAG TPA: serine/threonine protein kinase [Spongiibacteraceae bacterium]|nr:serine/threonine protein kinase [Spongiibacteraceae bacterium]HCS27734.1 serine/threonine protein kinase [Spongiibacteraceae bacterium]